MKKIISVMLILLLTLNLFACKRVPEADGEIAVQTDDEVYSAADDTEISVTEQDNTESKTDAIENSVVNEKETEEEPKTYEEETETVTRLEDSSNNNIDEEVIDLGNDRTLHIRTVDFDTVSKTSVASFSSFPFFASLDDYMNTMEFDMKYHIIFKGIKKEDSTQYITVKNDSKYGEILDGWYSETPIEVIEPYYGDINVGDRIIFNESVAVLESDGEECIIHDDSAPILKKNTEYIFFLSRSGTSERENIPMYSYIMMSYSVNELTDEIKKAESAKDIGLQGFKADVYTKYYYEKDKLDLSIDLDNEIKKLIKTENLILEQRIKDTSEKIELGTVDNEEWSLNTTLEKLEIQKDKYTANLKKLEENSIDVNTVIAELEDEDKALVERMKAQYGYK